MGDDRNEVGNIIRPSAFNRVNNIPQNEPLDSPSVVRKITSTLPAKQNQQHELQKPIGLHRVPSDWERRC